MTQIKQHDTGETNMTDKKYKYKIIKCFIVWNEEDGCAASVPLWDLKSAQEFKADVESINNETN